MSRVDIVIRYIEVDFTQAPSSLGFRIMFVISKNSLYRGSLYRRIRYIEVRYIEVRYIEVRYIKVVLHTI